MKPNKIPKPASADQVKSIQNDAFKNISELGKIELARKKKVDPIDKFRRYTERLDSAYSLQLVQSHLSFLIFSEENYLW